jgi:hypothetical protein
MPITNQIIEALKERPYLCFRLDLDPILVGSVMTEVEKVRFFVYEVNG